MSKGVYIEEKENWRASWLLRRCGAPRVRRLQDMSILQAVCPSMLLCLLVTVPLASFVPRHRWCGAQVRRWHGRPAAGLYLIGGGGAARARRGQAGEGEGKGGEGKSVHAGAGGQLRHGWFVVSALDYLCCFVISSLLFWDFLL